MKIILRIIETLLVLLGIATGLVFIFLGIPDWSPFQPTLVTTVIPIATMVAAWTTLLVAYAAFRTIKNSSEQEKRRIKERLLNEIIDWAVDVRKYAGIPHIIDHSSYHQMMSADRFFTLKYNGKKFLIAVKKQAIGDDLQSLLSNAIDFLDNNWQDLATKPCRREEIVKDLDKIGETIIEKAEDLLSSNS